MKTALTGLSSAGCQARRMSLTGRPLLGLAVATVVAALAVAVLAGRLRGWRRPTVRAAGVLLAQVAVLVTAGLAVNREEQFYPDWAALSGNSDPVQASYRTAAGGLDGWLDHRADGHPDAAQTFTWRPPGWADWHLRQAPQVSVPAGYLTRRQDRWSAVVVLGPKAAAAPDTVVVTVQPTAATTAPALSGALPAALGRDLRVTAHRWALVAADDAALATGTAGAASDLYPVLAVVGGPVPAGLPQGLTTLSAGSADAAVTWAAAQTPPPLAASAPAGPIRRGGGHGSGQSHR